jgi:large subunit ribosomal protein L17
MRHNNKGRAFNRPDNQRAALVRSLARSLILEERISTTEAKAKELRPFIEKLVTRSKADTVANRRLVASRLGSPEAVKKLFATLAPRYEGRAGGYTRIVKRPATANGRMNAYIAFI